MTKRSWTDDVAEAGRSEWGWSPVTEDIWRRAMARGVREFMVDDACNWRIKPHPDGGWRLADYRPSSIGAEQPWPERAVRLRDLLEATRDR